MKRKNRIISTAMSIVIGTSFLVGCGSDMFLDLMVSDTLGQLGVPADDGLEQITVGDLVWAFRNLGMEEDLLVGLSSLTVEQLVEIAALQEFLNLGEISDLEFDERVRDMIGA